MPDFVPSDSRPGSRAARDIADRYVAAWAELDPMLATRLGTGDNQDQLPDLSPAGQDALDALARSTLAELAASTSGGSRGSPPWASTSGGSGGSPTRASTAGGSGGSPTRASTDGGSGADADDRRCARLLAERLDAKLAMSAQREHLCAVSNLFGPPQRVRTVFLDMPATTDDDWAVIASRMGNVPKALAGYRASLAEGMRVGMLAGPRVVRAVIDQFGTWVATADGKGWFAEFAADASVPAPLRAWIDEAASSAIAAVADLRDWLASEYQPLAAGRQDGVGRDRYLTCARACIGANLDLAEAYSWGWSQFIEIREQMRQEAARILPGATVREAMRHLDAHGEAVEGVDAIRARLQRMMDEAIADLDGTVFDIADPVKVVEARIAPEGSAAAPYYTQPSMDFSRPGRTWLPTLGRTRFPLWGLVSTWYHEGVPGHHLQLAQWKYIADRLSAYQTGPGGISACSEGWALYAERLMDELGYLTRPGDRLGYLDAQMMRAIRVIIDIGMHTGATIPAQAPVGAGMVWTPELAREFFAMDSGRPQEFVDSEIVRYLSMPGQAISYKLGERAWLAGRDAARSARGAAFDLKAWHMGALSLGSLGLDDLADELAAV
jgi:uncharacterized protein (DUF885 family)